LLKQFFNKLDLYKNYLVIYYNLITILVVFYLEYRKFYIRENLKILQNLNCAIFYINIIYFGNFKKVSIYLEYNLKNIVKIILIKFRFDLILNYNL
jgi:hypothetical protein